ncbi:hypothetical protein PPACK8108_LOCUS8204 [Phakopsora pachyrhizi]|uniref:Ubiquitinyl hydrolase 1 n=1 Tax=Phakopsora pachyrhizi TaxID=170000 RepID=A0AAV0AW32_PHAPC|nr:hypothetical protein PPACK8108_LOCUS8204 [Phakopsora pachyrhizi]
MGGALNEELAGAITSNEQHTGENLEERPEYIKDEDCSVIKDFPGFKLMDEDFGLILPSVAANKFFYDQWFDGRERNIIIKYLIEQWEDFKGWETQKEVSQETVWEEVEEEKNTKEISTWQEENIAQPGEYFCKMTGVQPSVEPEEIVIEVLAPQNCKFKIRMEQVFTTPEKDTTESLSGKTEGQVRGDQGKYQWRNIDEDIRNTQAGKSEGVAGWLKMPLFGYSIANHLRIPLYYVSLDSMRTYFPTSNSYSGYPPFCMAFVNSNHYVVLHLKKVNWSIPAPPIDVCLLRKCSSRNKNLWLQSMENDLKLFQNLILSASGGAVINLD